MNIGVCDMRRRHVRDVRRVLEKKKLKYTNNIYCLIPVESACECYPHLSAKPVPTPVSFAKDFCGQASNFKEETNCKTVSKSIGNLFTYIVIHC